MGKGKIYLTCGLAVLILFCGMSSAQEIDEKTSRDTAVTGKGVVIELEHSKGKEAKRGKINESSDRKTEIDFIIGGQGKDGIAKRGVLKISE